MTDDDELAYRAVFGDEPPEVVYPPSKHRRHGEFQQLAASTAEVVLLVEDDDGLPIGTKRYHLVYRDGGWEPPEAT
jgi:hypothetical protein